MNFYELAPQSQAYLHAIELHACLNTLERLLPHQEAVSFIKEQLTAHRPTENAWEYELNSFLTIRYRKPVEKHDLVLYYLVAGCGINRIQSLLKVGQSTIYRIRDNTDWNRKRTTLEGMFLSDPQTLDGLQRMTKAFQMLDGFRVSDPNMTPSLTYSNNAQNFHAKTGPSNAGKAMLDDYFS